jgi:hypothetical protein
LVALEALAQQVERAAPRMQEGLQEITQALFKTEVLQLVSCNQQEELLATALRLATGELRLPGRLLQVRRAWLLSEATEALEQLLTQEVWLL